MLKKSQNKTISQGNKLSENTKGQAQRLCEDPQNGEKYIEIKSNKFTTILYLIILKENLLNPSQYIWSYPQHTKY